MLVDVYVISSSKCLIICVSQYLGDVYELMFGFLLVMKVYGVVPI